jgi:hypothetical protein
VQSPTKIFSGIFAIDTIPLPTTKSQEGLVMKKTFRVVQPRKRRNDPEKTDWTRLGIAWSDSKGTRIKLNALPIPDENGEVWISLFEEDGSGAKGGDSSNNTNKSDMDDEIPF